MRTTRSKRMALAQLLVGGCASVFGAGLLIVPGQAQYVPPPAPPPPAPVVNPPSPDRTVPQPIYTPLSPSTPSAVPGTSGPESTVPGPEVTSPANEAPPSTTGESGRGASVAKRSIHHQHHHHHNRVRFAGYTLGSYCGRAPLVFVFVRRRFTRGRPRACGGPAFMIMLRANSRAGGPGMGDLRGLPVITGTEVAPLPSALVDRGHRAPCGRIRDAHASAGGMSIAMAIEEGSLPDRSVWGSAFRSAG
jgi:hypothetical protein